MQRLKGYAKKALYPPVWCLAALAAVSGIGLYFVFTTGADAKPNPAVYILYTLSAYTLLILCLRAAFCRAGRHGRLHDRKGKQADTPCKRINKIFLQGHHKKSTPGAHFFVLRIKFLQFSTYMCKLYASCVFFLVAVHYNNGERSG